jgi:preprotein translocase subunit SecG
MAVGIVLIVICVVLIGAFIVLHRREAGEHGSVRNATSKVRSRHKLRFAVLIHALTFLVAVMFFQAFSA